MKKQSLPMQILAALIAGMTITEERKEEVDFSIPYYTEAIVAVCKADDDSLDSVGTVVDLLTVLCKESEEN